MITHTTRLTRQSTVFAPRQIAGNTRNTANTNLSSLRSIYLELPPPQVYIAEAALLDKLFYFLLYFSSVASWAVAYKGTYGGNMEFEWDDSKEWENIKRHGISFKSAAQIWRDPLRIERYDDQHSVDEERWQTVGFYGRLLFVVFTERDGKTRLISARLTEPEEW